MRGMAMAIALMALLSFSATSFASDWDIVGKVLTGIEGARILTGGKLDVIGTVTGIGSGRQDVVTYERTRIVEVPVYSYREVWVPGHYVRYQTESCGNYVYSSSRGRYDRDDFRGRDDHRGRGGRR